MFGLSWGQIAIIVLVGVFVLGPERIPTAVRWVTESLRKMRTMAAGAQAQLNREIGPELDELRRQIADLQSLKELQELRDLRDLHPKRLIGNTILGEEFAGGRGGLSGFLGLGGIPTGAGATAAEATGGAPVNAPTSAPTPAPVSTVKPVSAVPPSAAPLPAATPTPAAVAPPAMASAAMPPPSAAAAARPAAVPAPAARRLPAAKVVGAPRPVAAPTTPAPTPTGFDVDAT